MTADSESVEAASLELHSCVPPYTLQSLKLKVLCMMK